MLKSFRNASMAIAAAGLAFAVPASAAPATHIAPGAHAAVIGDMSFEHKRQRSHGHDRNRNHDYRGAQSRPYYMGYDRQYGQPVRANTRVWRGNDGRYYCKRDNGTTGLIIGGAVGALVGREIDSRGDRTVGTVLGAAGGALLGREVDRSGMKCR